MGSAPSPSAAATPSHPELSEPSVLRRVDGLLSSVQEMDYDAPPIVAPRLRASRPRRLCGMHGERVGRAVEDHRPLLHGGEASLVHRTEERDR